MRTFCITVLVLLCISIVLSGCASQREDLVKDMHDIIDLHKVYVEKISELQQEGIYWKSFREEDGVLHIEIFNADQRTIHRVKEVLGDDVEAVIWNDDFNIRFVRGTIKRISVNLRNKVTTKSLLKV